MRSFGWWRRQGLPGLVLVVTMLAGLLPAGVGASPTTPPPGPPSDHAHFESGHLHGFAPGAASALAIVAGDARQGHQALAVSAQRQLAPGDTLATWAAEARQNPGFATLWVKGTPGRTVRLEQGDRRSAIVRLDGAWQAVGLSLAQAGGPTAGLSLAAADPTGATPVTLRITAPDGATAGDVVLVDDARIQAGGMSTTAVTPGTRVVTLNGDPFVGKGYVYWPLSIGLHWPASTWADPPACQQDARLMGAAGVTVLRIPFEDHAEPVEDLYRQCLDAFHAHGISVLWLIGPPTQFETVDDTPVTADLYAEKVMTAIRVVGQHPATAFWTIGNEIERSNDGTYWLGNETTGAPALLEELIQRGKAADPGARLWGTTICCPLLDWMSRANVPSLDFWGVNAYSQPFHLAATWYGQLVAADSRPVLVTETGADRYHCFPGIVVLTSVQTCTTSYRNPARHSGERQEPQRDWNATIWDRMEPNLATASNPQGAVFGATYFMWSDLWWFSLGFLTPQSPANRQVGGVRPWSGPDGVINIEFMGAANAQPPGVHPPRVTSLAFDALAARWAATPPPTIGNLAVQTDGTTITATWQTSEPATSEAQSGANGEDGRDGAHMREDNTIFGLSAYDPTPRTSHSVSFTAPTLDPGLCQKVVVRSFTPDGRSVTSAPVIAGCPSTGRTG